MKTTLMVLIGLIVIGSGIGLAQYADGSLGYLQEGGMIMGGVGFAQIDDETYFTINFRPELAIGKFGMGLNVNLLFNTETGEIRAKDWDSGYDYARMIRYLRYGRKNDPVYTRVGTLDAARLGHGSIINYYTNEASYDERKIGLAFDIDFGMWGFESVASNLGRAELIGGRAFFRPLRGVTDIPIIKNLAVGGTFARDFDPDAYTGTDDGVSVFGLDVELPLLRAKMAYSTLYYDWAKIDGYGNGHSFGIMAGLRNIGGMIALHARLERRLLGKKFIASYFDAFYEVQRYQPFGDTAIRKHETLKDITEETKGVFGELQGGILNNTVRLIGMFSRLDEQKKSGIMHFAADAPNIPMVAAHATYDKINIETVEDVFTLDANSVARVGLGYKIKPYLIFYCDYIWTFVLDEDKNQYKPQERIEPRLVFVYNF